jgi:hypothetical protein
LRASTERSRRFHYEDACSTVLDFIADRTGRPSFVLDGEKGESLYPDRRDGKSARRTDKDRDHGEQSAPVDAARQERPIELRERIDRYR